MTSSCSPTILSSTELRSDDEWTSDSHSLFPSRSSQPTSEEICWSRVVSTGSFFVCACVCASFLFLWSESGSDHQSRMVILLRDEESDELWPTVPSAYVGAYLHRIDESFLRGPSQMWGIACLLLVLTRAWTSLPGIVSKSNLLRQYVLSSSVCMVMYYGWSCTLMYFGPVRFLLSEFLFDSVLSLLLDAPRYRLSWKSRVILVGMSLVGVYFLFFWTILPQPFYAPCAFFVICFVGILCRRHLKTNLIPRFSGHSPQNIWTLLFFGGAFLFTVLVGMFSLVMRMQQSTPFVGRHNVGFFPMIICAMVFWTGTLYILPKIKDRLHSLGSIVEKNVFARLYSSISSNVSTMFIFFMAMMSFYLRTIYSLLLIPNWKEVTAFSVSCIVCWIRVKSFRTGDVISRSDSSTSLREALPMTSPLFRKSTLENRQIGTDSITSKLGSCSFFSSWGRSSRMLLFFVLNFSFLFVELFVGFHTNSLGLISDSAHMFFDCAALAIALFGAWRSSVRPTREFPFGYVRYEVVSAFVNALFLIGVGLMLFMESFNRIFYPTVVMTGYRIVQVSVIGFLVNLVGLWSFSDHHHHLHFPSHLHNPPSSSSLRDEHGSFEHSAGARSPRCQDHTFACHACSISASHALNDRGVFLHMLFDTLGSISVIFSSLAAEYLDWTRPDAFVSMGLSGFIVYSAWELLASTWSILVQRAPDCALDTVPRLLSRLSSIPGVVQYRNIRCWSNDGVHIIFSAHIRVEKDTEVQAVLRHAKTIAEEEGVHSSCFQVERL